MWSDRARPSGAATRATALALDELVAQEPRHVRGRLAPGRRIPGGERPGRGRAQSLEFDGLSAYVPGDDDVRAIDWRASARSARPQVRRYAAQSHRARMIVLALRPELYFGTRERLMAKTGALVAARLAWESQALGEPVGLAIPGIETVRPRRGRRHVLHLLDRLVGAYGAPAGGDVAETLAEVAPLLARGDEICLIDDLGPPSAALVAASRRIGERLRLTAVLVDDALTRTAPPAGAYPLAAFGAAARRVLHIPGGARAQAGAAALKAAWRRALADAEWRVLDAAALLPTEAGEPR